MARYIYQGTYKDGNGRRIDSATVNVYLAGGVTAASVYAASSGSSPVNSVTTDSRGSFEFYVDDTDYTQDQLFKITLSKTGFQSSSYDDIGIFPKNRLILDGSNNFYIDGRTSTRQVTVGAVRQEHTAGITGTRAYHFDVRPNSLDDTNCVVARLDLEGSSSSIRAKGLNLNVDITGATNAHVNLLEAAKTGDKAASVVVDALDIRPGVRPIHHHSGTVGAVDTAFKYDASGASYTNITTAVGSAGTDVALFDEDNDIVYLGHASQFDTIEVLLATVASGAGVKPTFEYSKGAGVWGSLPVSDDTNGFRENGNIFYASPSDWATDTVNAVASKYWVRITRTANNLSTIPIEDTIKISSSTEYEWDENGNLTINDLIIRGPYADVRAFGTGTTDVEIQAAIDSLPSSGGVVLCDKASYTISNTVTIPNAVLLKGIYGAYYAGATKFISNVSGAACVKVGDGSTLVNDAGLENIHIEAGTGTNGIGIHLHYARGCLLRKVSVRDFTTGVGIQIEGQTSGGAAAIYNSVYDYYLSNNLTNLKLTGEDADNNSKADEGSFVNGRINLSQLANSKGIHIEHGSDNTFLRTSIYDQSITSGTLGIHIDDGTRTDYTYGAGNNSFVGGVVEFLTSGVKFEANTANNVIRNFRDYTLTPVNDLSGGHNSVEYMREVTNVTAKPIFHNSQTYQNIITNGEFERWEAGTSVAPSEWTVSQSTVATDGSNQRKGTYCAALTYNVSAGTLYYTANNFTHLKGRVCTFGAWVKTAGASTCRLAIYDGVSYTRSAYHSGGGAYEFLSIRKKLDSAATQLSFIVSQDADNVIYVDQAMACEGMEMSLPVSDCIYDRNVLYHSFTYDPSNLADGAGETHQVTVVGAALGDFVMVSAPYDLQDITVTGYVQATDTVEIRVQNESGGAIDLASGTWAVMIFKYRPN